MAEEFLENEFDDTITVRIVMPIVKASNYDELLTLIATLITQTPYHMQMLRISSPMKLWNSDQYAMLAAMILKEAQQKIDASIGPGDSNSVKARKHKDHFQKEINAAKTLLKPEKWDEKIQERLNDAQLAVGRLCPVSLVAIRGTVKRAWIGALELALYNARGPMENFMAATKRIVEKISPQKK